MAQHSDLLSLPREVRDEIYHHAKSTSISCTRVASFASSPPRRAVSPWACTPSITFTTLLSKDLFARASRWEHFFDLHTGEIGTMMAFVAPLMHASESMVEQVADRYAGTFSHGVFQHPADEHTWSFCRRSGDQPWSTEITQVISAPPEPHARPRPVLFRKPCTPRRAARRPSRIRCNFDPGTMWYEVRVAQIQRQIGEVGLWCWGSEWRRGWEQDATFFGE
ncbi:hypothetical protein B0H67DRAFT_640905 [Lasiosphaeris hirsuta]|uniref:Uncharacterized protein n=1 Tax=Lasiosphaeris hirsuta TaxID=260670 RepID=A0AA40AYK9_9PEZI|nr:hypothetical protein B0H67DRAFT_640905 [Lasiosphaeris hirsuta]